MKICKKCGSERNGARNSCVPCTRERRRKWREANPEEYKRYLETQKIKKRKLYHANTDKYRAEKKRSYEKHRQATNERNRKRYRVDPHPFLERCKLWRTLNPEKAKHKPETIAKSNAKMIKEMSDAYIKGILKKLGFQEVSPQLIELERRRLKLYRIGKEMRNELSGQSN